MFPAFPPKQHRGFSLVELSLALGIATYCLVAVSGMLSVGINSDKNASRQTAAANIAKAVEADLYVAPGAAGSAAYSQSKQFGFQIPNAGQGGAVASVQSIYLGDGGNAVTAVETAPSGSAGAVYRVSVTFAPPASSQRGGTTARVLVTWPALADLDPAQWPRRYAGSYEIVTVLDRN
jgi:uncharacterized protein (TIGR02598 family)